MLLNEVCLFVGSQGEVESDDERLPRFERNWTVGRVIRPRILEDGGDSGFGGGVVHDSQSLRRLWDEDNKEEDNEEVGIIVLL